MKRSTTRSLKASKVDLENVLRSVEDALEEAGEPAEDDDGAEAADTEWEDGLSDSIEAIRDRVTAIWSCVSVSQPKADALDPVNAVLKKALERLTSIETAQSRISGWGDGVQRTADRMINAANALANLDRVSEYTDRSIFLVKAAAAGPNAYVAMFPGTASGLEEARALCASRPALIVCSAVWHGAVKVGEAVG